MAATSVFRREPGRELSGQALASSAALLLICLTVGNGVGKAGF